jgi:NNP family nitrate/nitrite transporter-like MFS transporter
MSEALERPAPGAGMALWVSTISFTACFAAWTIFAIIGVQIKKDLGLNDAEFGLLAGTPILTGSLARILLGVWTDQFGGRVVNLIVMLAAAVATYLLSYAHTYPQFLLAALGVGLAGGCFAVGVAYVSRFYPKSKQGTVLGIFGAGNIGSAFTKIVAPMVMVAFGWTGVAKFWAIGLAVIGIASFLLTRDDPDLVSRRQVRAKPVSTLKQLAPLKNIQVWRFALYYFFVFGGFVSLALWLPHYLVGVYNLDLRTAGLFAAAYSIPASLFRAVGGALADKIGARKVMYLTFGVSLVCCFLLAYPATSYVVDGVKGQIHFRLATGIVPFTIIIFVLGFFMSLGKAAVYKHIPVYYPDRIGSVGGTVGMIGGIGGFILPIAFGFLNDLTGIWTSCFMLLFVLVGVALLWMHFAIRRMERKRFPDMSSLPELPELQGMGQVPGTKS